MRRVELKTLSGATAFEDAADGAALRQQIAAREGVPAGLLRLTCGARDLYDNVLPDGCVRVLLRLEGGKGGFGAMLRTSGARGIKTTNFDACRDLNGRRLRHVNAEAQLREWEASAEERKQKKAEQRAREAASRPGPAEALPERFDDDAYEKTLEETRSSVADAFKAAAAAQAAGSGSSGDGDGDGDGDDGAVSTADPIPSAAASGAPLGNAARKRRADAPAAAEPAAAAKAPKLAASFDPLAALLDEGEEGSSEEGE